MQSPAPRFTRIGLLAAATTLWGCSSLPSAPKVGTDQRSMAPNTAPHSTSTSTSASLAASTVIDGRRGGSLTVGDFAVIVPKGAYGGSATITITVANPSVKECDLDINPISFNNFKVPVTLSTNFGTTSEASASSMFWWNPSTGAWQLISSSASKAKRNAPLSHFSKYKGGRAGW